MIDTLLKIATLVADKANWLVIFYILFGLVVLWVIVRVLNLSPVHLTIEIVKEIMGVIFRTGVTRTTIDGFITVAMFLLTAVTVLVAEVRELPEFLSILRAGAETQGQPVFLAMFLIFMTVLTAILSLLVTR